MLPNLGVVCNTASTKAFGISQKQIIVVLKTQNVGELTLDQRLKHKSKACKLLVCRGHSYQVYLEIRCPTKPLLAKPKKHTHKNSILIQFMWYLEKFQCKVSKS